MDGPLAGVQTADLIRLDVASRRLQLLFSDEELNRRVARRHPAPRRFSRDYYTLFLSLVMQAHEGCDFDFLRARPDDHPYEPQIGRS